MQGKEDADKKDVELMLKVQNGDDNAFEKIVERHQKWIINLAYKYIGNSTEAEDIAQEIFIKIYKARKRYKPTAKFTTWLHTIAVNVCLNSIRGRKNDPNIHIVEDDILKSDKAVEPSKDMENAEISSAVKAAIDALPENQRLAVILTRYEDMSYDEAAEVMNTSVEALKSLLFRAKDNLKERLAKYVK